MPLPRPDKTPPETRINFTLGVIYIISVRRSVKKKLVRLRGIEPLLPVPKTGTLSVELQALESCYNCIKYAHY